MKRLAGVALFLCVLSVASNANASAVSWQWWQLVYADKIAFENTPLPPLTQSQLFAINDKLFDVNAMLGQAAALLTLAENFPIGSATYSHYVAEANDRILIAEQRMIEIWQIPFP